MDGNNHLIALGQSHRAELRASAIPEDIVAEAGLCRMSDEEAQGFGFRSPASKAGLFFPYWDVITGRFSDRFARLKPDRTVDGRKYLQPVGETNRLYFSPGTGRVELDEVNLEVLVVEGEKKALSVVGWARRRGRRVLVVGIGGCQSWRRSVKGPLPEGGIGKIGSEPIPDLGLFSWSERRVTLCLDGDVIGNPAVSRAEIELAKELHSRGAEVFAVRIPPGREGNRRGTDDLIAKEGDDAWEKILEAAVARRGATFNVSDLLRETGLDRLAEGCPLPEVEGALRKLQASLKDADSLQRGLAREGAIRCLAQAKLRSPSKLVDAALQKEDGKEQDELQGRTLLLTDPEPWADPVDGALILNELLTVFTRYIVLPPGAGVTLALWVLFTHIHDAAFVSPMIVLKSPTMRAGKTRTLTLLRGLSPRPLMASNVTPAVLFRTVEEFQPTLLIDEADSFLADSEELRGLLNSGHTRSGAVVVRCVGDDFESRQFRTFCPKAIATIGNLPGTIEDRGIVIPMRRKAPHEVVTPLRLDRIDGELEPLCAQAARWAKDNIEAFRRADPEVPYQLHDRAADNWRPLLAIADLCGGVWPEDARWAARTLCGVADEADNAPNIQLFADLRNLFEERKTDRLSSRQIVESLATMEDRPWPEWKNGKPLSETRLARLLKPFQVKPRGIRMNDGSTPKGYLLYDLRDTFARYLPSKVQQPQQINEINDLRNESKCNTDPPVAPRESAGKPRQTGIVAGVALSEPLSMEPTRSTAGSAGPAGDPQ